MDKIALLDPDTRCVALVGMYLQAWAHMEAQLNKAVGAVLGLKLLSRAIVTSNIQLRDKTNILRVAIRLTKVLSQDEIDSYISTIKTVIDASIERNMMAHDMFWSAENVLGVEFNVVKAKNRLDFPSVIWDIEKFRESIDRLRVCEADFEELALKLTPTGIANFQQGLVNSLLHLAPSTPNSEPDQPATVNRLFLQPQSSLDSTDSEASSQTGAQTPASDQ